MLCQQTSCSLLQQKDSSSKTVQLNAFGTTKMLPRTKKRIKLILGANIPLKQTEAYILSAIVSSNLIVLEGLVEYRHPTVKERRQSASNHPTKLGFPFENKKITEVVIMNLVTSTRKINTTQGY